MTANTNISSSTDANAKIAAEAAPAIPVELVFVIDRSGSMGGLEDDTIGGFNSLLKKQQEQEGEAYVTTVLFDDRYEMLHDHLPLAEVAPLTRDDYYVRGCTALLDAMGRTVKHVDRICGGNYQPEERKRAESFLDFVGRHIGGSSNRPAPRTSRMTPCAPCASAALAGDAAPAGTSTAGDAGNAGPAAGAGAAAKRRVLFVTITDGYENASREYDLATIRDLVAHHEDEGWEFLFLGANIDAVETANNLGIKADHAVDYVPDAMGTSAAYEAMSEAVCCARQCSAPLGAGWKKAAAEDFDSRASRPRR